jgi:hypothetical protein
MKTVKMYEFTSKEDGERYRAQIVIDENWLLMQLGARAMASKGKRAQAINGAVVCTISWINPEKF